MKTLDKNTLQQLYVEEQLTIRAIADKLSVNYRTVHNAMMRWRIPRRPNSVRTNRPEPDFPFDQATLRYHYLEADQSIVEIAVQLKVSPSTVYSAMKHWHIPRRRSGRKPLRRSPES